MQATAPSLLPVKGSSRIPPKKRTLIIPDEVETFNQMNNIDNIEDLSEVSSPDGFSFKKPECSVLFYRIFYEEGDITPYMESIEVNQHLHVKLHHKGSKVPLPGWFNSMNRCKMTSVGMLQNFVSHMHNIAADWPHHILAEIQKNIYFKPQGRSPYSPELLRFALMQRYTSSQAYTMILGLSWGLCVCVCACACVCCSPVLVVAPASAVVREE